MRRKAAFVTAVGVCAAAAVASLAEGRSTAPTSPAGKRVRVALVTDAGQLNDRGFNQLAYQGLKLAQRRLGIDGRVIESRSSAEYVPNMTTLARRGYDLVIGVGYAQGAAVATVAKRFPKTRFAIVDVSQRDLKGRPRNVVGLIFREEQAGYLAGYLAGLTEKRRPGRDVISSVGGWKEPPVDRFIAGYRAGARRASPGIRLLNGYSRDWDDLAKCKELALDQIARGSRVVFQVAGGCGLGALDAAKERNVWGIGVDADQSFLGPHVLTSALKRVDQAVFLTIRSVETGRWRGGRDAVFGLRERGVGLGTISRKVPRTDVQALRRVEAQIAAGKIRIPKAF